MPPMDRALAKLADVRVLNVLDQALLSEVERRGGVTAECRDRMWTHLRLAAQAGSDAVVTTCNIYSSVIADIGPSFLPMWVLAVDQPMVDTAVGNYRRIGVLASVADGLRQQSGLLRGTAIAMGKEIELVPLLREVAFTALTSGNPAEHDRILLEALDDLDGQVDVVVLAQASMARLVDTLPQSWQSRVLASPDLAVAELARLLRD
jgi:hypothetical protein